YVLFPKLVTHWNAGATLVPHASDALGHHAAISGYNLGQSVIWLVHPRFNPMLETVYSSSEVVTGTNKTGMTRYFYLNPGFRWSHNFKSGLQIVPGIGVPVGVGPSRGEKGVFLYLSFEHALRRLPDNTR